MAGQKKQKGIDEMAARDAVGEHLGFVKGAIQLVNTLLSTQGLDTLPKNGGDVGWVLNKVEDSLSEIEEIFNYKCKEV